MQIILRGPAAGYEAEHTARLFFPDAEKTENLPQDSDFVLAQSHLCTDTILLRLHGRLYWKIALRPQGADPEYTLCRLLYTLLGEATGSTPPWGMMTGVRPVRIIHDMRASGATEDEIRARFLDHFACTPEKFALALGIADLQKPVLDAADPMDCSVYAGIPFCPTRCSYCSFVSRTVGDKATRALVQPYVDKLCAELTAIRETADRCGLHIRTFYIGGGTPTSLSAAQLEQLMSHIAKTFDLAKLDEYTVEAGRPDCTDAEKLRIIKKYGATRISINPQTFSDQVLQNIGRRHTAQDIIDCFAAARAAGHTALFAAALVEELDALGLDFGGVAVLPLLILPFAGLQAAFHKHEAALGQVLGAVLRRFLEHHDAVPLGTVHTVAVAVRVGFVRGDVERADGAAALGIAQFGIAAEPADDHNLVQHSNSLQDAL